MVCARFGNATLLAMLVLCGLVSGQQSNTTQHLTRDDLAPALNFEAGASGDFPKGWGGGPPATVFADSNTVHSGHGAVRLERNPTSPSTFSTVTKSVPMEFSGKTIELRGFLKLENVSEFAGFWLREDGEQPALAFDNMQSRHLNGSKDWTEYSVKLDIHPDARQLFFGALLVGTGNVWADDLQLLVDDKPVWDAPHRELPKTPLDLDHEFDGGSRIQASAFTAVQIENLATLGKVWGFLKYHHPLITSGKRHWDYDLFRILPTILAAPDRASANADLLHWIDQLGPVIPCTSCAELDDRDLSFGPDLKWIDDESRLGHDLSQRLHAVWQNRLRDTQFYLSLDRNVKNPVFQHELGYESVKFPDLGCQLLALYRFWNIMQYWSPYRDVIGEDWNGVLSEFIPRIGLAKDVESYKRELFAFIAMAHDGHANLWRDVASRPPTGDCQLPVNLRFLGDAPVVTSVDSTSTAGVSDLRVGDIIEEMDGTPVATLVQKWAPYYSTSNRAARMHAIARYMTRGECGDVNVGIRRQGQELKLSVKRSPFNGDNQSPSKHDVPGPAFRLLSKDVAYLKLSAVKAADCPGYIEQAAGTKAFIIDIRNYPSEFVVFALGSHLVDRPTDFARFSDGDLSNPGAFHWTQPVSLMPEKPHYNGKIAILADETSISQAEYTTMAFRSAPGAIVVGSTTQGADGNISPLSLPGDVRTMISGIGVFYPDKRPTQQLGIIPDVFVTPTVDGIRAGRDEVLEMAVRKVLGERASQTEIEQMTRPTEQ